MELVSKTTSRLQRRNGGRLKLKKKEFRYPQAPGAEPVTTDDRPEKSPPARDSSFTFKRKREHTAEELEHSESVINQSLHIVEDAPVQKALKMKNTTTKAVTNEGTDESLSYIHDLESLLDTKLNDSRKKFCGSQRQYYDLRKMTARFIKDQVMEFFKTNKAQDHKDRREHPTNAIYQKRNEEMTKHLETLHKEEQEWQSIFENAQTEYEKITQSLKQNQNADTTSATAESKQTQYLPVAQEIQALQSKALESVASFSTQMSSMDTSLREMDRVILQADYAKGNLFNTFQNQKGFSMSKPKSLVKALLNTSSQEISQ